MDKETFKILWQILPTYHPHEFAYNKKGSLEYNLLLWYGNALWGSETGSAYNGLYVNAQVNTKWLQIEGFVGIYIGVIQNRAANDFVIEMLKSYGNK